MMLAAADPECLAQLVAAGQLLQATSTLLLAAAVAMLVVGVVAERRERQRNGIS